MADENVTQTEAEIAEENRKLDEEKKQQQQQTPTEPSDEEFEALVEKRLGAKPADLIKKSEQVKVLTEDEKKEAEEKKQSEILKFALDNNQITRSFYDSYLQAKASDKIELAKKKFIDQNKDLSPEEAVKQFNQIFRIDEDDELIENEIASPNKAKKAARLLAEKIAEEDIDARFGSKINELPKKYEAHQAEVALVKQNTELIAKAVAQVDRRLKVTAGEIEYGIDLTEADIQEAQALAMEAVGKKNLTAEEVKGTVDIFLKAKNSDRLLQEAVDLAYKKGVEDTERGAKGLKSDKTDPAPNSAARDFLKNRGIPI